jgi:serine O-acetyltransferase
MRLFKLIAADLRAKSQWCYGGTGWRGLVKTALTDGTAAMIWYRLMQAAGRWRLVPLEMLCNKLNAVCCQCIIGRGAEFGPGFVLIHSQGTVINGRVRGGAHVYLEHQVTIGAERRHSPVLGDRVFVGAGAKIVGAVHIGDDCRIGANAVVISDIPSGTTAVGIPARIVRKPQFPADGAAASLAGDRERELLVQAAADSGVSPSEFPRIAGSA